MKAYGNTARLGVVDEVTGLEINQIDIANAAVLDTKYDLLIAGYGWA